MALGSPGHRRHHDRRGVGDGGRGVVMSTLSPLASFCSMPSSSHEGAAVPEPSSREYTEMGALAEALLPPAALAESPAPGWDRPMRPRNPKRHRRQRPAQSRRPASTASRCNRRGKREDTEDAFMSSFLSNARVGIPEPPPARGHLNSRKRPTKERRLRASHDGPA